MFREYDTNTHLRINWPIVVMYGMTAIMIGLAIHFAQYPGTWVKLLSWLMLLFEAGITVVMIICANITRVAYKRRQRR